MSQFWLSLMDGQLSLMMVWRSCTIAASAFGDSSAFSDDSPSLGDTLDVMMLINQSPRSGTLVFKNDETQRVRLLTTTL